MNKRLRVWGRDQDRTPSLRISHIVQGRESRGTRVYNFVDPEGAEAEKSIPESVVLHRWRRRMFTGYTFGGARLNPGLWRALQGVFGGSPEAFVRFSEQQIAVVRAAVRCDDGFR